MQKADQDLSDEDGDVTEVERTYLREAGEDASRARRNAIRDGIAGRRQARVREAIQARLISHGYVRRSPGKPPSAT